jgi:hypothetical protein
MAIKQGENRFICKINNEKIYRVNENGCYGESIDESEIDDSQFIITLSKKNDLTYEITEDEIKWIGDILRDYYKKNISN